MMSRVDLNDSFLTPSDRAKVTMTWRGVVMFSVLLFFCFVVSAWTSSRLPLFSMLFLLVNAMDDTEVYKVTYLNPYPYLNNVHRLSNMPSNILS